MDRRADRTQKSGPGLDRWLGLAVVAAVAVRVALALSPQVGGNTLRLPDSMSYHYAAKSLLEEGQLWFSETRRPEEAQRAKREPGYPLFVAGCYAVFGPRPAAVRLVQALVGAVVCWVVYALARSVAGRTAGRAAALVAALYPYLALTSALVLTESLYTTLLWLALWATTAGEARRRHILGSGLAWAGLAAVRGEALVMFSAVAAAALLVSRRRAALAPRLVAGVVGLVLVTGVWAWRNQRAVGHPVFTSLNVGETLYDSLWPGADGSSNKQAFMPAILATQQWQALDEVGRDRWLRQMALQNARAHPGHVLRLAWRKVARTWSPVPSAAAGVGPAGRGVLAAAFLVVTLAGVCGSLRHRRRWRTWAVWLVPAVVVTAAHLVIVGSIRYRIPAMPFFVVMAGASLVRSEKTGVRFQMSGFRTPDTGYLTPE